MNKAPLVVTIAALLALAFPARALRAADPGPDRKPAQPLAGGEEGDRAGFAPEDSKARKQREMPAAKALTIETKDGVQPFKDGYIVRDGRSILFRHGEERATMLFALDKEAAGWWALGNSAGVVYVADGKLRFKPENGEESELGAAPDGVPAISAESERISWISGGKLWVASVGRGAAVEVALPEGRELLSIALSPDGTQLYGSFFEAKGERKNWEIQGLTPLTEGKLTWSTRWNSPDGAMSNLAVGKDHHTILYIEPRVAGGKTTTALQMLPAQQIQPVTLAVADGVADVFFATGGDAAWFSAKGANGRRKIWRVELSRRPDAEEYVVQSVAGFEDGDCAGLAGTSAPGSGWFVRKTEGAADRVCHLSGF
jgi:hypothetical protein